MDIALHFDEYDVLQNIVSTMSKQSGKTFRYQLQFVARLYMYRSNKNKKAPVCDTFNHKRGLFITQFYFLSL